MAGMARVPYCEIGGAGDAAAATGGEDGGDAGCDGAADSNAFTAADLSDGAGVGAGAGDGAAAGSLLPTEVDVGGGVEAVGWAGATGDGSARNAGVSLLLPSFGISTLAASAFPSAEGFGSSPLPSSSLTVSLLALSSTAGSDFC
jgi:hypothetical protein